MTITQATTLTEEDKAAMREQIAGMRIKAASWKCGCDRCSYARNQHIANADRLQARLDAAS